MNHHAYSFTLPKGGWAARLTLCGMLMLATAMASAATVRLGDLNLDNMTCGWNSPQKDRSIDRNPLTIAGKKFDHGVGTHATSTVRIDLHGTAQRFTALVGVDDDAQLTGNGSVTFTVSADGKQLWTSGVIRSGNAAKAVDVDLTGKKVLVLTAGEGNDGMNYDHADWANAEIAYEGTAPVTIGAPKEEAVILTPPAPPTPRINGAKVFGVRPGSPFLYTIAATGDRPMTFSATGLPEGLTLDAKTGRITGKTAKEGEYNATLTAKNEKGEASRGLKIVVGDKIALTPPLGWNSWNCWGGQVRGEYVLAAAKAMVDSGLINHGWTYINIDDAWQAAKRGGKFNAIQPNDKFPDFEKMCTQIHEMGLKLGIYSTPVRTSYAGYVGGSSDTPDGAWVRGGGRRRGAANATPTPAPTPVDLASIPAEARPALSVAYGTNPRVGPAPLGKYTFAPNDAKQWAAWGVDYLKYDWNPNQYAEVKEMTDALRASGRDIVYSLSNSMPFQNIAQIGPVVNSWRTTGDITDTWGSMSGIGFQQDKWFQYGGPGHWNDPDMLVVGRVGWGNPHPSKLTPNEQYTHISLWCLLSAPLLIGCDMSQLDAFTLNLLTNDEVLAIDQDPLGQDARQVVKGESQVWVKPLEDGSLAVGLFNLGDDETQVAAAWSDLKIEGKKVVRDLWRQKDLGQFEGKFEATVPRHGVVLVKISK